MRFQRNHKLYAKHLPTMLKETTDEAQKATVKQTYQLLRSFCASYNFITIEDKEADKFCIPADFEAEIAEVLTEEYSSKFKAAFSSSREEYLNVLPDKISS